jgi:hypothetical protein
MWASFLSQISQGHFDENVIKAYLLPRVCGTGHPVSDDCNCKIVFDKTATSAVIVPRNDLKDTINTMFLDSLSTEPRSCRCKDSKLNGTLLSIEDSVKLDSHFRGTPSTLTLKKGMSVMITRTFHENHAGTPTIANGTFPTVHELNDSSIAVELLDGTIQFIPVVLTSHASGISRIQFPIVPAYALKCIKFKGKPWIGPTSTLLTCGNMDKLTLPSRAAIHTTIFASYTLISVHLYSA